MSVTARIEPVERGVELIVSQLLSPKAQGEMVAEMARSILAEAEEANRQAFGEVPSHQTTVDGRKDAPLESVKPDGGLILFDFNLPFEMVTAIWQMLREKSPVGGPPEPTYRDSHMLFVDGIEADPKGEIPAGREYVFLNPVPYARKIEIGRMHMRLPGTSKVYQTVEQLAKRRFGKIARIQFTYRAIAGQTRRGRGKGSSRSPALVITLR